MQTTSLPHKTRAHPVVKRQNASNPSKSKQAVNNTPADKSEIGSAANPDSEPTVTYNGKSVQELVDSGGPTVASGDFDHKRGHEGSSTKANVDVGAEFAVSSKTRGSTEAGDWTLSAEPGVVAQGGARVTGEGYLIADSTGMDGKASANAHAGVSTTGEVRYAAENARGDSVGVTAGGSVGLAASAGVELGLNTQGDKTTIQAEVSGQFIVGGTLGLEITVSDETVDDVLMPVIRAAANPLGTFGELVEDGVGIIRDNLGGGKAPATLQ